MDCALCAPLADDEVWTSEHWRVIVNHNQNTLGKCFVALKRHDEDICNLTDAEVADLWVSIRNTRDVLTARFRPDRFNYAFLMNQDRQVHLHIVPRYLEPRSWEGDSFSDPHWGAVFGPEQRVLDREQIERLRDAIRSRLALH